MISKPRILPDDLLLRLAREHGTPLHVYDAETIRARVAELRALFDVVRYAQKANPGLALLRLLREQGCRVDAVSAGELERAEAAGFTPVEITYTADLFDDDALRVLARRPVAVNLGSAAMIDEYAALGTGRSLTLRLNPGFGGGHHRRVTTGGEESKHGIWHEEFPSAVTRARSLGLEVTGLHVHLGSGVPPEDLARAARALEQAAEQIGPSLERLSAGGGLPVPYRPGEPRADLARLAGVWQDVRERLEGRLGHPIELEVEPGRYLVAEAGLLLCRVRTLKRSGRLEFALVDAGFNDLIRPALYGAYHEISKVGPPSEATPRNQVVAGPLCESADLFTQDGDGRPLPRLLPPLAKGDLLCLHDTGAYGSSMASNYNGRPRAAEVLVDGQEARLIRRRERSEELWSSELGP